MRILFIITACAFIIMGCNEQGSTQVESDTKKEAQPVSAAEPHGGGAVPMPSASLVSLPDVVAKVNGVEIKKTELEKIYNIVSTQAKMANQPVEDKDLIDMALGEVINAELLKQETAKNKIDPAVEKVDGELTKIKSQFPDEAAFKKAITDKGLTIEELRKNIKDQMAIKEMFKTEIEAKISVSDKMVEEFYGKNPQFFKKPESIKASHILIKQDDWEDKEKVAEGRKKIEGLLARVKKGEDFAEMAKASSEGPSAPKGGDLGTFGKGQMVKPFEDAAFKLNVGETSGIVQTNFGFHIIKLTDKQPGGVTPLKDATKDIKKYLSQMEGKKLMGEYLTKLRSSSSIEKLI